MLRTALALGILGLAWGRDDREDLFKAVRKAADVSSYAFRVETRIDLTLGDVPQNIPVLEGKYEKETGLHLKIGDRAEIFSKERTFIRPAGGNWQEFGRGAPPLPGAQGGPGFGRMMLRTLKPPHEEVLALEKGLGEIRKAEAPEKVGELECALFGGDFNGDFLRESPFGKLLSQFGGSAPSHTGRARAWVASDGVLVRYEITSNVAVEIQGNALEFSLIRTVSLSDPGKTRVEVPEGLKKLLGEKPEDPGKERKKQDY